ncbi:MAG TPA: gas vesicle protein [Longimicrobiaceae bacterium]|nr:gas vesicle protein [Longimicrobiaceae bacterium]
MSEVTRRRDEGDPDAEWEVELAEDDEILWDDGLGADTGSLVDLVNRLLDKGVVIAGDVTISVAGVDLVYLGLNAILTSVATAREHLGRPGGTVRRE